MALPRNSILAIVLGFVPVAGLSFFASSLNGADMADRLQTESTQAIAQAGGAPVKAHYRSTQGWPTRHPLLTGGEQLTEALRNRVAKTVGAIKGVGGIRWSDGTARVSAAAAPLQPLHCQEDVEALLRARTIRFEEGSARIDEASNDLVMEVAAALHPCLGAIIAITGHTDSSGPEPGNLALSLERAMAVRDALIAEGIPADGLRTRGLGSRYPAAGLEASDPANRRIEFSVVAITGIKPTPVDTPGPR